jgi:hypothetical protein
LPVAVGFARTSTVQLEPAASVAEEQETTVSVKSAALLSAGAEQPVAAAVPEFWSVNIIGAELPPTVIFPKSWVRGVQASDGAEATAW